MDFSGKRAEAQKLLKDANKLANPSFLGIKMKADWMSATPLYERAALLFRQSGSLDQSRECWERASDGHKAQQSVWHAASALEKAADISREGKKYDQMAALYLDCAELYIEAGRPRTAAEAASRGATAMSEVDPAKATKLHAKAIQWLEESEKDGTSPDIYRQAVLHAVRSQQWSDAIKIELRLALSSYNARSYSTSSKSYLSAVIVALYSQDGKGAWQTYQDALDVPEFASSDQAFAAQDLFQAFSTRDEAAIDACIQRNSCLTFLDNCIVRLVRKMTSQTDVRKTAAGLPSHLLHGDVRGRVRSDEGEEEDLT
jgi:tetratricopeptide (TPR) repeat protein